LLTNAIAGGFVGFLLDLLGTRIVPEYWGAHLDWRTAGCGAGGAMLAYCFPRKSKNSN
jgi:hypothetical protein